MVYVKPLPNYLIQRYHGWKATTFEDNHAWYRRLASEGQRPRAMVISCCDSRVNVLSLFGAEHGEFFVHRNIANLVPPYTEDGDHHGTSAAVEYAVSALHVAHIIVLGHSSCGGVQGCYDMCTGAAPELDKKTSFIGRWMEILRPGFDSLTATDEPARRSELEKASIRISLENLMTFPFVSDAVRDERLSLHGLWTDIGEGGLLAFDGKTETFQAL